MGTFHGIRETVSTTLTILLPSRQNPRIRQFQDYTDKKAVMELISEAKAEVIEVIEELGDDRSAKASVKGDDTLKASKSGESSPAAAVVANGIADMSEPINIVDGQLGLQLLSSNFLISLHINCRLLLTPGEKHI